MQLNSPASFSSCTSKHSFSKSDLESCTHGFLFGWGNAQLPSGPLLMIDRVIDIQSDGGQYDKGYAVAEFDITPDSWFFRHHFFNDPIMPGCLLIESMWQLIGFHMAWSGYQGRGRAMGSGKTRFMSSVTDVTQTLVISIHVRNLINTDNPIYIANGEVLANNKLKCRAGSIKIGLI